MMNQLQSSADLSYLCRIRLLGYAGTNLLLAVPALVLSIISALRLLCPRPHQPSMLTATTRTAYSTSALTSLPSRRSRASRSRANPALKDLFPPDEPPLPPTAPLRLPKMLLDPRPPAHGVAGRAPAQAKHSKFHLPFTPAGSVRHAPSPQPSVGSAQGSQRTAPSPIVFSSPAARAEPTVVPLAPSPAPPDAFYAHDYHDFGRGAFDDESGESGEGAHGDEKGGDDGSDGSITEVHHAHGHVLEVSDDGGVVGSFRWVRDPERESFSKDKDAFYAVGYGEADEDRLDAPSPSPYAFPPYPRIRRSPSGRTSPLPLLGDFYSDSTCRAAMASRGPAARAPTPTARDSLPGVPRLHARRRVPQRARRHPRPPRACAVRHAARRARPRGVGPRARRGRRAAREPAPAHIAADATYELDETNRAQ